MQVVLLVVFVMLLFIVLLSAILYAFIHIIVELAAGIVHLIQFIKNK